MHLPADDHVHSEWSWDTDVGSMERTCARAVELGVPSVAFTEHAEFGGTVLPPDVRLPEHWQAYVRGGLLVPPPLDVQAYLAALDGCRERFPTLRIVSGVELSEPHWHLPETRDLLRRGDPQRVLASVHSWRHDHVGDRLDIGHRFEQVPPEVVVREYLAEAAAMVERCPDFEVLAHIDYPVRYWPAHMVPYRVTDFEADYRQVLEPLAASDRILEVNTKVPLAVEVVRWWRDCGGAAVTFASDAHRPDALASGFAEATAMAEAAGFRPGPDPVGYWLAA